jgi:primosomal protein N' (replication factor Y)
VTRLVSVAAPVAVDRGFTYAVPESWREAPAAGSRVLIPFGSRHLIGVVRDAPAEAVAEGRVRELVDLVDPSTPALTPDLVRLCEWMQEYYVAPVGEVYRLTLPGLLTGEDVRTVSLTAAGEAALGSALGDLAAAEARLLRRISEGPKEQEVARVTGQAPRIPGALRLLVELAERGLVELRWAGAGDEAARTELHFRRTDFLRGAGADEGAIRGIVGRSKQRRALLDLLDGYDAGSWVSLGELRGPFPRARELLAPLVEAGLVAREEQLRALDPFAAPEIEATRPQAPTRDQELALAALRAAIDRRAFAPTLLHGITGSGKTEVYLQAIAHALAAGGGAIVLVPEIALTPQLSDRFRARFGETVAVLHSGLTPRQRLDAWQQIRGGHRRIAIGPRSAVFAPVQELRVIVVDEEHDGSFKQEEGVRYNARDVALVRARELGALVLLGSATPSLESYELARSGRYAYLRLQTRPTPRPLPEVELVPLAVHQPDPETLLTARLRGALRATVAAKEQAILFLNRRGFATTLVCNKCGALHPCPDCSAPSMTYHLARNRLMCHLCGLIAAPPARCPSCGDGELLHGNPGTERVEVSLAAEVPGCRVLRLDRDTSRGRALLSTLNRFRRHEADVLVGTQMLSKGHDFPGVTLVGILQADHGLGLPDLRASERTFQLLTQVAGRAGRGERPGRVLIQAFAVRHPAIAAAARHDYEGFAAWELERRRELHNPPFGHLALVRVSGLDAGAVTLRAEALAAALRERVAEIEVKHAGEDECPASVLGPVPSPIERINSKTRWQILLRARARPPLRWLLRSLRPLLGAASAGTTAIPPMPDPTDSATEGTTGETTAIPPMPNPTSP